MEINLKAEFNPKIITDALSKVEKKRWPKILSYATTETAFYVRNKLRSEMPKHIDRPKPFTVNSIFVNKGSTRDPESTVEWRKPSGGTSGGRYLRPLVDGGGRQSKGFERKLMGLGLMDSGARAVPTKDAPLDAYGNVSGGFIKKVVDALAFNPFGSGYGGSSRRKVNQNIQGIQASKTKADNQAYFAVTKATAAKSRLSPGVYEKKRTGFGWAIRRLWGFIEGVTYRKSFPFYEIGLRAARDKIVEKVREGIEKRVGL